MTVHYIFFFRLKIKEVAIFLCWYYAGYILFTVFINSERPITLYFWWTFYTKHCSDSLWMFGMYFHDKQNTKGTDFLNFKIAWNVIDWSKVLLHFYLHTISLPIWAANQCPDHYATPLPWEVANFLPTTYNYYTVQQTKNETHVMHLSMLSLVQG